jgi:tetratricopeptide (TPR) repeat protein
LLFFIFQRIAALQSMQVRSKLLRSLPEPLLASLLEHRDKGSTTWVNVARSMQLQKINKLEISGGPLDAKQIFLRAIELDPNDSLAYTCLGNELQLDETIELPSAPGRLWTRQQLILKALDLNSHNPTAMWQLADTLYPGEVITLPDGSKMNEEQLCMKAVHLDANDTFALRALARRILPDWSIRLASGAPATKESLYLQVMLADPLDFVAVANLVKSLFAAGKSSKEFPDGTEKTITELILLALSIEPRLSDMWNILAMLTPPGELQTMPNGEKLSQTDLFLRAIAANQSDPDPYYNLARTMVPSDSVDVLGTPMTPRELFLTAIKLNPTSALAYYYLAQSLLGHEQFDSIALPDGSALTKKDLLIKAIDLDETDSRFYNALAEVAAKDGQVQLLNGNKLSHQQLQAVDAARFNSAEHRTTKITQITSAIGIALVLGAFLWETFT